MEEKCAILIKDLPSILLKKKTVRSHFEKFGTITKIEMSRKASSCVVHFLTSAQAKAAKSGGSPWNNLELNIDFSDDAFDDELNWLSEDPFEDPKEKARKTIQKELKIKKVISEPKKFEIKPEPKKVEIKPEPKKVEIKETKKIDEDVISEFELLSKVVYTDKEKLSLLEERDKLVRSKLAKVAATERVRGTCPDMCPEKERIMRQARSMVAPYEMNYEKKLVHTLAVKDYTRSSADQEEPLPHELRPESVLTMTMEYLITNIMGRIENEDEVVGNWFDFCWSRLRAIRKDIIQQQLCDLEIVNIVEQCARFHILCYDRLWGSPNTVFDDKINTETLMNCLQSLMHMYEDLKKQKITCPNEAEFKAYLILLKLNSGFLLSEYQQYSEYLQCSPQVKDAVAIHTAFSNNMYATYFKLLRNTTYLNSCLMQRFFAHLRSNALSAMVRAYCPPNSRVMIPVSFIQKALKFDSKEDTLLFCESFGFGLKNDNFVLSRNDFYHPDTTYVVEEASSLVKIKRVPIAEAVCGNKQLPRYIPHDVHSSFTDENTLKPSSVDASDQEEKMLRDVIERQLIKRKGIEIDETDYQEMDVEEISDKSSLSETMEEESEIEVEEEEEEEVEEEEVEEEELEEYNTEEAEVPEFKKPLNLFMPKSPLPVSKSFQFKFQSPSPVLPKSPMWSKSSPAKSPTPVKSPTPTKSPTPPPIFVPPKAPEVDYERLIMAKLRKKLSEKMKKTNARKYARIWKNKVDKIRKIREKKNDKFYSVSLESYTQIWGCTNLKNKATYERLLKRKKASLLVTAILHTNLVDQLDKNVYKISTILNQILTKNSIFHARKFGNVCPSPVFWKLIVALPENIQEGSTFPNKLKNWCQAAFYSNNQKLGDVSFFQGSIPIFTIVDIVEGQNYTKCQNISALILVTAKGWESPEKTEERLSSILKLNTKIPVSIMSLGSCPDFSPENNKISFLHQSEWKNADDFIQTLSILAQHAINYNLKIDSVISTVEIAAEKLLDAIYQDSYIDEKLINLTSNPNGIIYFYNKLIDKIKDEIIHCSIFNLYGTAYEFKDYYVFPEHYNDPNFEVILTETLNLFKLPKMKENYSSSVELLNSFRDYCGSLKCGSILSSLMRAINPPDDDRGVDLNEFLKEAKWFSIVETIFKANIFNWRDKNFNIVFRRDKIEDLTKIHWWMDDEILMSNETKVNCDD